MHSVARSPHHEMHRQCGASPRRQYPRNTLLWRVYRRVHVSWKVGDVLPARMRDASETCDAAASLNCAAEADWGGFARTEKATPSFPRPCERCACVLGPYFGEGDNSFVGYPEWPTVGQKSTPRRRDKT